MNANPTKRQLDVLRVINDRRLPPTIREIGDELGVTVFAIVGHLGALTKRGLLEPRPERQTRGLFLTAAGKKALEGSWTT